MANPPKLFLPVNSPRVIRYDDYKYETYEDVVPIEIRKKIELPANVLFSPYMLSLYNIYFNQYIIDNYILPEDKPIYTALNKELQKKFDILAEEFKTSSIIITTEYKKKLLSPQIPLSHIKEFEELNTVGEFLTHFLELDIHENYMIIFIISRNKSILANQYISDYQAFKMQTEIYINNRLIYGSKNYGQDPIVTIPEGTILFKGVKNGEVDKLLRPFERPSYFTDNINVANIYTDSSALTGEKKNIRRNIKNVCNEAGPIGVYQNNKEINLINLATFKGIELATNLLKETPWPFNQSFKTDVEKHRIYRDSNLYNDQRLLEKLCNSEYDGYIFSVLPDNEYNIKFHSEIAICPKGKIDLINIFNIHDRHIDFCDEYPYDFEVVPPPLY